MLTNLTVVNHFTIYTKKESLCYIPEINVINKYQLHLNKKNKKTEV